MPQEEGFQSKYELRALPLHLFGSASPPKKNPLFKEGLFFWRFGPISGAESCTRDDFQSKYELRFHSSWPKKSFSFPREILQTPGVIFASRRRMIVPAFYPKFSLPDSSGETRWFFLSDSNFLANSLKQNIKTSEHDMKNSLSNEVFCKIFAFPGPQIPGKKGQRGA